MGLTGSWEVLPTSRPGASNGQQFPCPAVLFFLFVFRWVHPSLYEGVSVRRSVRRSVRPSVRPSVGWSVTCYFQMLEMDNFYNENHWGRPTLTLLQVLNVLNVLKVLNVLNVLNMPIGPMAQRPIAERPIAQGPIDSRNNQS